MADENPIETSLKLEKRKHKNIYDYGFDTRLNRGNVKSSLGYNSLDNSVIANKIKFGNLNVGAGNSRFGVDPTQGQWLGAEKFADAPFSVDMNGNVVMQSATIAGYKLFEAVVAADGNGDYDNIQDAIDAGAKRIFVRAGTYYVSSPIVINSDDIRITGEHMWSTYIYAANNLNDNIFEIGDGATINSGILIENLYIWGRSANQSAGVNHCFYIQKTLVDFTIRNCFIAQPYRGSMIYMDGAAAGDFNNITIDHNVIYLGDTGAGAGQGNGIYAKGIYNGQIINNYIDTASGDGIRILSPSVVNIIQNNFINDCLAYGVYATCNQLSISNNKIVDNYKDGINSTGFFITILDNQVHNNNQDPYTISSEISFGGLTSVVGNTIAQAFSPGSTFGIRCTGQGSSITGNTLWDGQEAYTSIYFDTGSTASIAVANASWDYATGVTDGTGGNTLANNVDST